MIDIKVLKTTEKISFWDLKGIFTIDGFPRGTPKTTIQKEEIFICFFFHSTFSMSQEIEWAIGFHCDLGLGMISRFKKHRVTACWKEIQDGASY